jgi:hypothetical protein
VRAGAHRGVEVAHGGRGARGKRGKVLGQLGYHIPVRLVGKGCAEQRAGLIRDDVALDALLLADPLQRLLDLLRAREEGGVRVVAAGVSLQQ